MQVILLKDVKGQGKKDDIIEVKPGYGMYLEKNNLAVPATKTGLKRLETEQKNRNEKEQELIKECEKIKEQLEKLTITFKVKTGNDDRVFGSISTKQISEELKKHNFNIDKKKIDLDGSITSLGYHNITINLHKKVVAPLKINLVKEN